jgi:hypothetical protein
MLTVLRCAQEMPFTSGCRVATGRSAVLLLIERWKPTCVFMPCFVPAGIIRPFQHAGVPIVFYRLNPDLRTSMGDLYLKVKEARAERPLIVSIRYFGYSQPTQDMVDLAHDAGGILLEDCAHALFDGSKTSDVILYSLNKFLPVTDGAIMVSRRNSVNVSIDESALAPLHQEAVAAYTAHMEINARIAAYDSPRTVAQLAMASAEAYSAYYTMIDSDMSPRSQSAISRAVEAATDMVTMSESRKMKSVMLRAAMPPGLLVRREPAQFAFPVRCAGRRREMVAALMNVGVLPSFFEGLWDHVPAEGFDFEREFLADHVLLPINESVTFASISKIASALREFC